MAIHSYLMCVLLLLGEGQGVLSQYQVVGWEMCLEEWWGQMDNGGK